MKAVLFLVATVMLSCAAFAAMEVSPSTSRQTTRPLDVRWDSVATGHALTGKVLLPLEIGKAVPTIVYLKNLSIPRLGQESDDAILADFKRSGDLVLVLDYAHDPKAISPDLNADVLKLRHDIADNKNRTLLTGYPVDVNHLFIIPEGFRLKRDVEFARDGQRVLGMDIVYPAKPKAAVPVLMEITCDNKDRMGSFSLLFCHDTLLEGGTFAGFASAMIDHPVPPPYKGIDDPMPQCIYRLKAAVRTLRAEGQELGLSGKLGAIGFSRGGPMAALLAATGGRADLEGDGEHPGVSSRVQAALVHGNRYDYTNLRPDDPMLARFAKAWGPRDENLEKWAMHGAIHYLTKDCPPVFLDTSDAESPEFRDGLEKLDRKLTELGVPHVYQVDKDGRGHRVSTDPKTLAAIYQFFGKYLRE